MTRGSALLLGILTFWPAVYILFFMVYMVVLITTSMGHHSPGNGPPAEFIFIFILHILTMLLTLGLLVYYIIYLFKSETIDKDKRLLWAVVMFFGGAIAMPIFWYLYIWKPLQNPSGSSDSAP